MSLPAPRSKTRRASRLAALSGSRVVPTRRAMPETPPLIGREKDLAAALEQLKRIDRGASASLLIRGDAGIGKTRLAGEVLARAQQVGRRVLVGRADEFDRGIPYAV